ncbi:MAG: hypothetical protein O3A59_02420 [Nitrospirae bacterium]|nr:hypothetical protein [Nitrospirota bacterium]
MSRIRIAKSISCSLQHLMLPLPGGSGNGCARRGHDEIVQLQQKFLSTALKVGRPVLIHRCWSSYLQYSWVLGVKYSTGPYNLMRH